MKNLQTILIVVFPLILSTGFTSCKKEPKGEYLSIEIESRLDNDLRVTVFPKETKPGNPGLYPAGVGGGFSATEFFMHLGYTQDNVTFPSETIYKTDDLNLAPFKLALNIFDSIHIALKNEDRVIIKFTHEGVIGYSENIFSEKSAWYTDTWTGSLYTDEEKGSPNRYTFVISKDKITTKNEE
jgi:hypothetical protein